MVLSQVGHTAMLTGCKKTALHMFLHVPLNWLMKHTGWFSTSFDVVGTCFSQKQQKRYAETIFPRILGSVLCFLLKKLSSKFLIYSLVALTLKTCCHSVKLKFVRYSTPEVEWRGRIAREFNRRQGSWNRDVDYSQQVLEEVCTTPWGVTWGSQGKVQTVSCTSWTHALVRVLTWTALGFPG